MRLPIPVVLLAVLLLGSVPVYAETILFVDFEDPSAFTLSGGYERSWIYWGIAPLNGTATVSSNFVQGGSQDGNIFYGSYAREYRFAPAAAMTIPLPDLSKYTNIRLTVALAAAEGIWEPTHRDSLHIIGSTTTVPPVVDCPGGGCLPVTGAIDSFIPPAYPASLRSQVYSIDLLTEFQDFGYPIDSSLKSLTFAFASTDYPELAGIDSVIITGDPIPEPSTLALLTIGLVGLVGYGWRQRKR